MAKERKIFFVVASGGHGTDKHYVDTIQHKRTVDEARKFLNPTEADSLSEQMHGQPFAVWGSVPGKGNIRTWESMEKGDYVLVYRSGKIILVAEISGKTRNQKLAANYWGYDSDGQTWELIYFLINEKEVDIPIGELNQYLGYNSTYKPWGFMAVQKDKARSLFSHYGDLFSLSARIERGEKPEAIDPEKIKEIDQQIEHKVERAPTEHDEMQWRLIRLGNRAHFDVWVPSADQNRTYEGDRFYEHVIHQFHDVMDVPQQIKNIDTVWKLGESIKSAFEIEHSTAVYSGILRLADLRARTPNSVYPLFIVADQSRRSKVFSELNRPTFSNSYLRLNEVVKYLSYDAIRKLDNDLKGENVSFDLEWLNQAAEEVRSANI